MGHVGLCEAATVLTHSSTGLARDVARLSNARTSIGTVCTASAEAGSLLVVNVYQEVGANRRLTLEAKSGASERWVVLGKPKGVTARAWSHRLQCVTDAPSAEVVCLLTLAVGVRMGPEQTVVEIRVRVVAQEEPQAETARDARPIWLSVSSERWTALVAPP